MEDWLKTRPKIIQELAKKYPPGIRLLSPDGEVFVLSYWENGSLSVSRIDPSEQYDAAVATRFNICANCIEQF